MAVVLVLLHQLLIFTRTLEFSWANRCLDGIGALSMKQTIHYEFRYRKVNTESVKTKFSHCRRCFRSLVDTTPSQLEN